MSKKENNKKSFKNSFKGALSLIAENWKTWILFLVFYNVVCLLIYGIIVYGLYAASLGIADISYVAPNTLGSYLLCPFTWLFILVVLIFCVFLIMFEISSLCKIYDASRRGEKINLTDVIVLGVSTTWHLKRPKNWMLYLYLLLMLPLLGISMASNMSFQITIPGFIMNSIKELPVALIALCIVFIILFIYVCRTQYSLVALSLDGGTFKDALKKSKRVIKARTIFSTISVFLTCLILAIVFAIVGMLVGVIVSLISGGDIANGVYMGGMLAVIIAMVFEPSIMMAQVSSLYYEAVKENEEALPEDEVGSNKKPGAIWKVSLSAIFIICLGLTILSYVGDDSLLQSKLSVPEIAAHRGDSGNAPENTMPAFKQAIEDGCCDWIELDVHQTKDGVVVVSHDDSLARIDGSDRCVHEMTYDELLQVDFGSRFSEEYAGTKIATLDEVLDLCTGKIKVQIEIKPTEYDNNIEQAVADIIKNHDMVSDCVVLSLQAEPLIKMKEIAPEITTMYCMALTSGEVTDIDFAEYISIEEQNATPEIVSSMQAQNRKVFAWTINDPDSVQYLVDCGVDVILTDYPLDIKSALDEAEYVGGIARTLRLMTEE